MEEINFILEKQIVKDHSPSVQYLLFNEDQVIYEYKKGFADIENKVEVSENTGYNAFSVTKTFTALSVLQLVEQNKIELDNPVIEYLPQFSYSSDITVKNLLNHSSGIPNPLPLNWIHLSEEHSSFNRDDFFKKIFIKHDKMNFKPNAKYAYSNLGYVVLGQLIEKVSGLSYEQYVTENIIRKIDLKPEDLEFLIQDDSNHAKGYHKENTFSYLLLGLLMDRNKYIYKTEGKWKSFKKFYVHGTPHGGLIGTPEAFMKYIQDLLKSNSRLISNENKDLLFTENYDHKGRSTKMCLSWFKGEVNQQTYYAHAGGGGGYYCEIRLYPEIKMGSVIFFNRTGMRDERILDKVDKVFINN